MKSINTILFFSLLFLSMIGNAQVKMYIEPTIHSKIGISSASSSMQTKLMRQTYYTSFETRSMRMSGVPIGINVGLSFNNEKQRLHIGITSEKATLGYIAISQPLPTNETQQGVNIISDRDISYTRLHLMFEQRLSDNTQKHPWYVYAGVGVSFKNNSSSTSPERVGELLDTDTLGTMIYEDVAKVMGAWSFSPSLSIGVKKDFYSKKGIYLLSSNLFYTHGIEYFSQIRILHYTANGLDRKIVENSIYTKGSGIYLQISRRFNLSFDTKKEKKNLEEFY